MRSRWLAATVIMLAGSNLSFAGNLAVSGQSKWQEECGSCHIAYPPHFLNAETWRQLMAGLDKHFGDNATISPGDSQMILDFLKRKAGSGSRHSAQSLRISDTPWFRREHDELPARAWSNPAIRSRANCTACHVDAARGDWSERGVHMPAGLDAEDDDD